MKINLKQLLTKENRKIGNIVVVILIGITLMFIAFFDWNSINSYSHYNNSSLSYVSGKVMGVVRENRSLDTAGSGRMLGSQELQVSVKEGELKGQIITVMNYLSNTHYIPASVGTGIVVCVDAPQNASPYYTVYGYDRGLSQVILSAIFALGMIAVGGRKGVRALLSLVLMMVILVFFLSNAIFHGISMIPVTLITLLVTILISLYVIHGLSIKAILSSVATMSGLLIAALMCFLCQWLLKIDGYNFEETETLLIIAGSTGLEIKYLLFVGILISSMGAVMDVGVSVISALYEVKNANPKISAKGLFTSGMNIGKDMIGTMSNTLILAFTGSELVTILLLMAFGYGPTQLLNSDFLNMELVKGISSTFAVIMTVPVSSVIGALFITKK